MLPNAYLLAKVGFDTAENKPAKNSQNIARYDILQPRYATALERQGADAARLEDLQRRLPELEEQSAREKQRAEA